jgi:hypothetical protein
MRITVAVHGHFKNTSSIGQDEMTFSVPDSGMRVRDLLESLNIVEEEIRQIVLNGRPGRLDEPVRHRVRIEFFPRERYRAETEAEPAKVASSQT